MTPERAKAILDSWCAMSPELLDNVCLSEPARLAVDELKRFREREPDVQNLLYDLATFTTEKTYTSTDDDLADMKATAETLRAVKL